MSEGSSHERGKVGTKFNSEKRDETVLKKTELIETVKDQIQEDTSQKIQFKRNVCKMTIGLLAAHQYSQALNVLIPETLR